MNKLDNFLISENSSIKEALRKININKKGLVIGVNKDGKALGVATDGDIRRFLIKNSLDNKIGKVLNKDFTWADVGTSREVILKQFDQAIRVIPQLDKKQRVVKVISADNFPIVDEGSIYVRSKSPVRVSFGGGGTDLTSFFEQHGGAVINATISLYSHATLKIREDSEVHIYSKDLEDNIKLKSINSSSKKEKKFKLILSVVRAIRPNFGFDLYLYSDYPMNSGLGGSAVVASSIIGCFNQVRLDQWTNNEIAELAFQAERIDMQLPGGWQDQYSTVTGGFNFMEFRSAGNLIHPIRMNKDIVRELEESLVLCDTGISHDSGNIHTDQREELEQKKILEQVKKSKALVYDMRDTLLQGKLLDFGNKMDQAWKLKRTFSKKISNNHLDGIYNLSKKHGALGGKLLGAGGGGFFLFFVPPEKRINLMNALSKKNLSLMPFTFEEEGLSSWKVREVSLKS